MIKLIICAALISTFFVTAYCEESASSSESESWDEGDDGKNEPTCPEYEVYSKCPAVKCDAEYCPRSRDDPLTCPIGIVCDKPRCVCMNNRHRDRKTKKCILTQNCPPFKCDGKNEEYNSCPAECPSEKCSDYVSNKTCGPPLGTHIGIVVPCKPQCRCKKGYYRNDNVCVKAKDCPCTEGCGGDPNAVKTNCGSYCGHSCSDYDKADVILCAAVCNKSGCSCKKNYVYDPSVKKCVKPEDCTPTCPENEVYSTCTQGQCGPKNCTQLGKSISCPRIDPKYCKKGCLCAEGYLRNENGKCIPKDQCPSSEGCDGDPNAVKTDCGSYCRHSCSDYDKTDVICPDICNPNGCSCKKNYVYDPKVKKCVKPKECTSSEGCDGDPNAVKTDCGSYCGHSCSDYDKTDVICPDVCNQNGCSCKKNYVYDPNVKKCVKPKECTTCPANEQYNQCPRVKCDADYCPRSRDDALTCPVGKKCDPPRCTCAFNTHRDRKTGKCIPTRDCPPFKCDRANEEFQPCPSKCPSDQCSDYVKNATCGAPLGTRIGVVVPCQPQCRCKEGFYRDGNGACVEPDDCPEDCPKNEVYSSCIQGECRALNCSQLGEPIACPRIDPKYCIKGCICAEGYLRDNTGKCIPNNECPNGCGGDPNAKPGSGSYCGHSCTDYNKTVACPKIYKVNACDCKEGYVYDRNIKKCVLPEKCTLQCTGQNEVYNSCPGSCPSQSCASIGQIVFCPRQPIPGDPECRPACRCKSNFYRNAENVCVSKDECLKCTKPNEVYDTCAPTCPSGTCDNIGKIYHCPLQPAPGDSKCTAKCRCKKGFYRNATDACVSQDECKTCPENEVYNTCPTVKCDADYCPKSRNDPQTCPVGIVCDPPRCTCGFNSRRDRNTGKCIPTRNCPPFPCKGRNEKYNACPPVCPGEKCSDYVNNSTCPKYRIGIVVPCKPQCRCNEGYYRDENDVCVSKKQCLADQDCHKNNSDGSSDEVSKESNDDSNNSKDDGDETSNQPTHTGNEDSEEDKSKDGTTKESDEDNSEGSTEKNDSNESSEDTKSSEIIENVTVIESKLLKGINDFSAKFYSVVAKRNPGKSLIMAPISILFATAPLGLYSTGITHKQILKACNLDNNSEIRASFPVLIKNLLSQEKVELQVANKAYLNITSQINENFVNDIENVFYSEAENVDFSQSQKSAALINEWVENKTNNYIQNLIPASAINYRTELVLVNAVFFKGDWQYKFDVRNTQLRDYYVDSKTVVQKQIMYRKANYKYTESSDLNCKVLEMPYEGGNLSMTIWLPNSIDGLSELAEKLSDSSVSEKTLAQMKQVPVKVYLPLMNITTSLDLEEILTECNLGQMFRTETDLRGLTKKPKNLKVTDAIHKAIIEVNEKGTKAAAATAIIVGATAAIRPVEDKVFNANHPFIFQLRYKDMTFFIGKYEQ